MKNLINNVNRKLGRKSRKGFSLVELLVVIAVIGVIAAIAIPAMSNIFGNSEKAKAKRNAQNIASVYSAARAAGADFDTVAAGSNGAADLDAAITKLKSGIVGSGNFSSSKFQVSLDTTEVTKAKAYLGTTLTDDIIEYTGTAGN